MNPDSNHHLESSRERNDSLVALNAASDWNVACHFRLGASHSEEDTLGTEAGPK